MKDLTEYMHNLVRYNLDGINMKFTFVSEIKFENLMDDDPANLLILTLIQRESR